MGAREGRGSNAAKGSFILVLRCEVVVRSMGQRLEQSARSGYRRKRLRSWSKGGRLVCA